LKEFLRTYFTQNLFIVPAEMIRAYSFPNVPNEKGIDTQVNITITHATEANILFPHNPNDCTVFLNPKYKDVSLKMLDMSFPDTPTDTVSTQFFRSQLQANCLGVGLQCSEEFENSYCVDYSGKLGERFWMYTSLTDFVFTVSLEIPNTNALFAEGAHSNQNTVIGLTANALKQGEEEVYHNISEGNMEIANKTPPLLAFTCNTFWVYGIDPSTGEPFCHYEINKGWNEFFKSYRPDIYNRMASSLLRA
jgi:hypothetical protein